MSGQQIGEHDPVVMEAPRLGIWIECECGWISPSYHTDANALKAHAKHVERSS